MMQLEKDIIKLLEALNALELRVKLNPTKNYSDALERMYDKFNAELVELLETYRELEC